MDVPNLQKIVTCMLILVVLCTPTTNWILCSEKLWLQTLGSNLPVVLLRPKAAIPVHPRRAQTLEQINQISSFAMKFGVFPMALGDYVASCSGSMTKQCLQTSLDSCCQWLWPQQIGCWIFIKCDIDMVGTACTAGCTQITVIWNCAVRIQ